MRMSFFICSKRPKASGSVSSVGTGYREKSPVPSALSPTPQVLGANMLQDALESPRRGTRPSTAHSIDENDEGNDLDEDHVDQEIVEDGNNIEIQERNDDANDVENPVFGARNAYSATIKGISSPSFVLSPIPLIIAHLCNLFYLGLSSARQVPVYARHKVVPAPNPPGLSATSNIPNVGGLVQNMNDLSAKTNLNTGSRESSNYSADLPDSLMPAWPACSVSQRVKKLSWDDDDRVIITRTLKFVNPKPLKFLQRLEFLNFFYFQTVDSVEVAAETRSRNSQVGNERLNLTVYF